MKLSALRSETSEARWVDLPEFPGVQVQIVPADNVEYRRAYQNAMQPHARTIRAGRIVDPGAMDKVTAFAVAKGMLRGWKGIEDENGQPIEFSREKALELAADPEYMRFFRAIEREGEALAAANQQESAELGKS